MKQLSLFTTALLAGVASAAAAQLDPSADTRAPLANGLNPAAQHDAALSEDGGDFAQLTSGVPSVSVRTYLINDLEYQSNATLTGNSGQSSFAWFSTAGVMATRRMAEPFSVEAAAALQGGFFSTVPSQDFWGVDTTVFLKYKPLNNLAFYVGPELYDYEAVNTGEDCLSRGIAPTLGATYEKPLGDGRTVAFASARFQHHYTEPSTNNRDVWSGNLGLARKLTDTVQAQGYYEYRVSHYTATVDNREDQRNTVGFALLYTPTATLRLRTGVTFADNKSNVTSAEFQTFNIGIGSSLNWLF